MEDLLKTTKGFVFGGHNSFEENLLPCYYYKKETGYVVFYKIKGGTFDFGIYDNQKRLISLFTNIDQSINIDWRNQFIARAIKDTTSSKLKLHKSKI